jgi:capsular polysaccharide export protein
MSTDTSASSQNIDSKKYALNGSIGIMSRAIANIPNIDILLGRKVVKSFAGAFWKNIHGVAGWGHKTTAQAARNYAKANHLPYLAIEDGFLRSVKLGKSTPPLSIVTDDIGIYYDASLPSKLEQLIKQKLDQNETIRAEKLIDQWRTGRVSKYNYLKETISAELPDHYILIADQTKGDASISLGHADERSFKRMLDAALQENPDKTILIKIHPEVAAGIKQGHFELKNLRTNPRIKLLTDDVHPVGLIENADAIYTVTSQIGFEGLLWDKPVRVFGMPFYAGWGLTQDEQERPERRSNIDLTQLIHAALIKYPRYIDPETLQPCEVEYLIDWIAFQLKMRNRFPSHMYALNFSWNKKKIIKKFFSNSEITFINNEFQAKPNEPMLVWGSTIIQRNDIKIIRLEDGFIRSIGLGADFIRPISWVADSTGIYYDATSPSDLETLLSTFEADEKILERAKKIREKIIQAGLTKYNLPGTVWSKPINLKPNQKLILVPGQVESDASITKGALDIKTNYALLKAVRETNPDAYIIYKPHPDVVAGLRDAGSLESKADDYCDEVIENASVTVLIEKVNEVHVLTSLTGFEALLRQKKVVVYGQPFYSNWGLTTDLHPCIRRTRRLSLDQLVAAVLIEYPLYVSTTTKTWMSPESAISWISTMQERKIYFPRVRKTLRRAFSRLVK